MNREEAKREITRIIKSVYPWQEAEALYDAGYRLVPELKVLSDEEIKVKAGIYWLKKYENKFLGQFTLEDAPWFGKQIAQAQLDSIKKQLEGK